MDENQHIRRKPTTRLLQQLRRHLQIPLRRPDAGMSEVCCQMGQELLNVLARAIPGQDTMNYSDVAQIMESRRSQLPWWAGDARRRANPLKQRHDTLIGQATARTRAQERRIVALWHGQSAALVVVGRQRCRKLWSDWNHVCSPAAQRLRFILDFAYATGLRISELVGVTLRSVQVDDHDDHWLRLVGKGSKPGKVALPPLAMSALQRYLARR